MHRCGMVSAVLICGREFNSCVCVAKRETAKSPVKHTHTYVLGRNYRLHFWATRSTLEPPFIHTMLEGSHRWRHSCPLLTTAQHSHSLIWGNISKVSYPRTGGQRVGWCGRFELPSFWPSEGGAAHHRPHKASQNRTHQGLPVIPELKVLNASCTKSCTKASLSLFCCTQTFLLILPTLCQERCFSMSLTWQK